MGRNKKILDPAWVLRSTIPNDGPLSTPCWIWNGPIDDSGYGKVGVSIGSKKAHRRAFEAFRGALKPGVILHHKCKVKLCCNPSHLEQMERGHHSLIHCSLPDVNQYRGKTNCNRGHEFTAENTKLVTRGKYTWRRCRACIKQTQAAWYQATK